MSGNHSPSELIELPFPPASLSGHNTGHWRRKADVVKLHRSWAALATLEAAIAVPDEGDIHLKVTFVPPDDRSDRINLPNRMKPYFDGIADALKVNDKRFAIPEFHIAEPKKPGRVLVEVLG